MSKHFEKDQSFGRGSDRGIFEEARYDKDASYEIAYDFSSVNNGTSGCNKIII